LKPKHHLLYLITDQISSVFLRGQLAHLLAEGYEVTVGTNCSGSNASDRFDPGVDVVDVAYEREPHLPKDLRSLGTTVRLIRRLRPDLVNASTPKAGLVGMIASWICRVPVRVYVVRGFRFETASGPRRWLYWSTEWVALHCANRVLFNSESLRAIAAQQHLLSMSRGAVLGAGSGNGINTRRFDERPDRMTARREFGIPSDATVVGFVGRLTQDKGVTDLVSAFDVLADRLPQAWLLLVGTFEPGDRIPEVTRQRILSDSRITIVGWLEQPETAYSAMDVLAFPSYREGLPNVPLEAGLCAVPVVGYAAPGTVDAVKSGVTGLLVPTGDVSALALALEEVLANDELRARLATTAGEWVRATFSRELIWQSLSGRYQTWLSAR
jgi:glycosyltransferase involved in cell wall biosynthesis